MGDASSRSGWLLPTAALGAVGLAVYVGVSLTGGGEPRKPAADERGAPAAQGTPAGPETTPTSPAVEPRAAAPPPAASPAPSPAGPTTPTAGPAAASPTSSPPEADRDLQGPEAERHFRDAFAHALRELEVDAEAFAIHCDGTPCFAVTTDPDASRLAGEIRTILDESWSALDPRPAFVPASHAFRDIDGSRVLLVTMETTPEPGQPRRGRPGYVTEYLAENHGVPRPAAQ